MKCSWITPGETDMSFWVMTKTVMLLPDWQVWWLKITSFRYQWLVDEERLDRALLRYVKIIQDREARASCQRALRLHVCVGNKLKMARVRHISALKCLKTTATHVVSWVVFLYYPRCFQQSRQIHKFSWSNDAFHLVACCYYFQERVRQWERKSENGTTPMWI